MKEEIKEIITYFLVIAAFLYLLSVIVPDNVSNIKDAADLKHIFFKSENSTIVSLKVPAVDSEDNGVSVLLAVEAVKGIGRTLVSIDGLLFWADTQHSIRIARLIAGNLSEKNLEDFDLIYSIKANASVIGGPSAGAAIAVATIFALNGEKPREDVMITGTINHDGTIGPVDGILGKAKAAKQANASMMLVPLLQGKETIYETNKYCHKFGSSEICTMETTPKEIDISEEAKINIVEVRNLEEAVSFFRA